MSKIAHFEGFQGVENHAFCSDFFSLLSGYKQDKALFPALTAALLNSSLLLPEMIIYAQNWYTWQGNMQH